MTDFQISGYAIVVSPLEDEDGGGYAAYVPDLPGCMSDGATREEALTNVVDAIEVWIHAQTELKRPVPAPGSAREARQALDKELIACLKEQGRLIETLRARVELAENSRLPHFKVLNQIENQDCDTLCH